MASIDALIREAAIGANAAAPLERTSLVDPALGTTSAAARSVLGLRVGQQWVAHHLIPFGVVAALLVAIQRAIVASEWVMDSPDNLIALPGNLQAYLSQPAPPRLPYQQGPHPNYDADVAGRLAGIATSAPAMPALALRAALLAIEQGMTGRIFNGYYNPKLD